MLTEDELAMLQAIRESGSLSRAAALLGKAPSTISHAARQLEARYDALLFDRRRYRLKLTPAGKLLADEAGRLLTDMERLNTRVRQIASGWEDRLTIVTDAELLEFQTLLPVIADFDNLKSGVGLRITHEVLGGTWSALQEGRLGVRGRFAAPAGFVAAPLQRDVIQQYCAVVVVREHKHTACTVARSSWLCPAGREDRGAAGRPCRRLASATPGIGSHRQRRIGREANSRSPGAEHPLCGMAWRSRRQGAGLVGEAARRTATDEAAGSWAGCQVMGLRGSPPSVKTLVEMPDS